MAALTPIAGAAGKLKFEYGVTEEIAFKYVSPKAVTGAFGPQFMWTLCDERKIYLDDEDGADVDRRLQELEVQPGELVRVTKVRHPRGGGHSFRVETLGDAAEPALEEKLEKSITALSPIERIGAASRDQAFVRPRATTQVDKTPTEVDKAAEAIPASTVKLAAAFMSAIDALAEAQTYAEQKNLRVAFSAEDIRAVALTVYIGMERGR